MKSLTIHMDEALDRRVRETAASRVYGQIKDSLREAGNPIPINDIWLSAQAIENGAVLVTFDEHFGHVPGLRRWEF